MNTIPVTPTMPRDAQLGFLAASVPTLREQTFPTLEHPWAAVPPQAMTFGSLLVESVCSSAIENINATVTQAALAYLQPRHHLVTSAGRKIAANMHATAAAFAGTATYADHGAAHRKLMLGQGTPRYAGLRKGFVRVGNHTGPAPIRVPSLMEDLAAFVESRPADELHASIAHAHFECIHPYPDGNGRIGRALLSAQLQIPVSPYISLHRQGYYLALSMYREGDASFIYDLIRAACRHGFDLLETCYDYNLDRDDDLSERAQAAHIRVQQTPVGEKTRMLGSQSKNLSAGFDELRERGLVLSASPDDTVFVYVPIVSQWSSMANTDVYGTRSASYGLRLMQV